MERVRFAADSPLEGDGFELSVPGRETFKLSWETGLLSRKRERSCWGTEGSNPSPSSAESATKLASCIAAVPRTGELIRVSQSLTSAEYRDPLNLDQHFRTCETSKSAKPRCVLTCESLLSLQSKRFA